MLKLHTLINKCWHRSPNISLIQKGRNRTKIFLTIAFNHYLENYLFNCQKFGKQKAILLPVICKRSFQVSASFARKKVHCMPIITALHLRETMSKFRSKRTFRSSPRKESLMTCSLFLGYFEFGKSLFVKLNCSLVDLSSRLEETQPVQWLKHR